MASADGRVVCIGECMVELREEPDGRFARGFGGDTLNTAVYLARLGIHVAYATALGDDPWSGEMLAAWRAEGVDTALVLRCAGRMPGLYVIQTDARGERRFLYWRDSAAARLLFALPDTPRVVAALAACRLAYCSGISLSLYGPDGRDRLAAALAAARAQGTAVAFDTNYRPRNWPDPAAARQAFREALAGADLIFAAAEDLAPLFGADWEDMLARTAPAAERVVKLPHTSCRIDRPGMPPLEVAAPAVLAPVDTTAAGDSFAAAYLAARLRGAAPHEAAQAGHVLAGAVIAHRGAIIPRAAMPAASGGAP